MERQITLVNHVIIFLISNLFTSQAVRFSGVHFLRLGIQIFCIADDKWYKFYHILNHFYKIARDGIGQNKNHVYLLYVFYAMSGYFIRLQVIISFIYVRKHEITHNGHAVSFILMCSNYPNIFSFHFEPLITYSGYL